MPQKRTSIYIAAYLIFVLAVWSAFYFVPHPAVVETDRQAAVLDLTAADLSDTVYYYLDSHWDSHPEQLLTPADFADEPIPTPQPLAFDDYRSIQYATHRMELKLPPGGMYALSMKSADYSMRIFIDGVEADSVGTPGATAEANVPRTVQRTYYFTTESETVTVLVQAANWVHREGAYPPNFYVGVAVNIARMNSHNLLLNILITGCLLTAFLYYLGIFLLNRRRFATLAFSVACLLLALMNTGIIQLFFPDYNWYAVFRLEYIIHYFTFALITLFLGLLFPRLLHRVVTRAYYGLAAAFTLLTLFLPTRIFSTLLVGFEAASILLIAYLLARLAMQMRERKLQNTLAFAGTLFVALLGVNDILHTSHITFLGPVAGQVFSTPIAMTFFVFCYGLVLSLEYAETERRMKDAQLQVAEAKQHYSALLKTQNDAPAHATPADYRLSARETDVLWLLLDGKTRPGISETMGISMGTVNTYCTRLYQKTETNGISELYQLFGVRQKPPNE